MTNEAKLTKWSQIAHYFNYRRYYEKAIILAGLPPQYS